MIFLPRAYLPITEDDLEAVADAVEQLDRKRRDSFGNCWYCGDVGDSNYAQEHNASCIWRQMNELHYRLYLARHPQDTSTVPASGPAFRCQTCRVPVWSREWETRRAVYDTAVWTDNQRYAYEVASGLAASWDIPNDQQPDDIFDGNGYGVLCGDCHEKGMAAVAALALTAPTYTEHAIVAYNFGNYTVMVRDTGTGIYSPRTSWPTQAEAIGYADSLNALDTPAGTPATKTPASA